MITTSNSNDSMKKTARGAGILYLILFFIGPFAYLISKSGIIVPGDAAATAGNLMASESVFRMGQATETVIFLIEIALSAILYVLLRPVSRPLALAAAFARLAEAFLQAVNLIPSAAALLLADGNGYLRAFEATQRDALAMLFHDINAFVILLWGLVFGFHLLLLGYLVFKSGFWPKVLGILLLIASAGYLAQSYAHIIAPQYDAILSTVVIVVTVPGELAFTVWLLWKGLNTEKWTQRALEAA